MPNSEKQDLPTDGGPCAAPEPIAQRRGFAGLARYRVLFVISNLEYGGAQRQVVELANRLHAAGYAAHVCSLSDYVPLARDLWDAAARMHIINKRFKFDVRVISSLRALISALDVNIVHAFLFDAELAARLASLLHQNLVVIGSERNTDYKRKWRQTIALRMTGRCVDGIIANSEAGRRFQARSLGIAPEKLFVVHNGVDVAKFRPSDRREPRVRLGLADDTEVIGMFASFKRQKNHLMFFRVARLLLDARPASRFLCVGSSLFGGLQASDEYQRAMEEAIESMGLSDTLLMLGNRSDLVDLYNACDVTVLTSQREGTPNVLLESMACGIPVVATNVADNALVVPDGRAGYVVPLDDDAAMVDRITHLLDNGAARWAMGREARRWVQSRFSLDSLMRNTTDVYRSLCERKANRSSDYDYTANETTEQRPSS